MIADLSVAVPLAIVCVVVSAFCAGTEVALFSIRRIEREHLARSSRLVDRRIAAVLESPRRLVATVVVGNAAFHSVLAVLAFLVIERWVPAPPGYPAWQAFWLAIGVTLPLIVLGTEITAKTLAAKAPLLWSRLCVLPFEAFALLVTPVRFVVQAVTKLLLKPLGVAVRPRPARDLSEEEFRKLVDTGSAQGQVDARERRLIHRVFEFSDKNVGQVMTPRERIFALSYDLPAQRLVKELAARGFSRVPIYQKSLDNVRGILNAKDLVRTTAGQPLGRPLGELLHEPLFVPRTTPVKRLFLTFKQKKVHMALVVSEYGKVLGLVTMDDLLSQIFGVLRDERAELQNSIPPGRMQARTPIGVEVRADADESGLASAPGAAEGRDAPGGPAAADPGDMPPADGASATAVPADHDDGLVHRGDDRSGSVAVPGSSPAAIGILDPPPLPVHDTDEITPPATDIAELVRSGRDDNNLDRSS
ncbi:MAG TPA: hemolysin family protein [Kofleriaceae bacterium]|jgi:CBS domain containing-hemolysin-like protein|nr:hemolysin family protein [Kofleriaceae bacterium]